LFTFGETKRRLKWSKKITACSCFVNLRAEARLPQCGIKTARSMRMRHPLRVEREEAWRAAHGRD
jgi:hypothetical protein